MVDDRERSEGIARISRWAWSVSALVSLGCLIAVGAMWVRAYTATPAPAPADTVVTSQDELTRYLAAQKLAPERGSGPPFFIPTGLYIESIQFKGPYTVQVSGYVWQRYANDLPKGIDEGFVMPEAQYARFFKVYQAQQGNEKLIGWSFFATLREQFDYKEYPLDRQQIRIELWHKDFERNVYLAPDLGDTLRSTLPRYPRLIRMSFWKTGTFRKVTLAIVPALTIRISASRAMRGIKNHPNCATTSPSNGTY
jgi:hypothetical protein